MSEADGGRSGCALASGIFFILLGALLLAQNLTDLRLLDYADEALGLFARYWPLILIAWGVYKVYRRFSSPAGARVSVLEVLALVLVVAFGFAVGAARDALERLRGSELGSELASVLGPDVLGPTHRFREETLVELEPGVPLEVENRFGGLRVVGSERSDARVVLDERVHHPSEDEARRLAERLRFELDGGTARVVGEELGAVEADLEIELPRGTPLVARVPGGRVTVLGLDAPVEIETGDDDVEAERLGSTLRVTTSHGDVRADDVAGDVSTVSRHGSLSARRLGGGLRAETARGSIAVEQVEGPVVLDNRNGSVRVARAEGPVTIRSDHTSVELEAVEGGVEVVASDRPVFVRDVGGSLKLEARNARVEVRQVRGDVAVDAGLSPLRVTDVGGSLRVRSDNGAVVAERLAGSVDVETTSEDAQVSGFLSSLSMRSEHGSLHAETDALGGDVALRTTYGDVGLDLPADASFRFTAKSQDGDLSSDLAGLRLTESREDGAHLWRGESERGTDGREIRVETDYGDIRIGGSRR